MSTKRTYTSTYKRYCCVYGCTSKSKATQSETSFFCIPRDAERRREWLTAMDREDLMDEKNEKKRMYNYVCADHFDDSAIITATCKRLKIDAVPTKLLPNKSQENIQSDALLVSHTQTQTENEEHKGLPNEIKIKLDPDSAQPTLINQIKQEVTDPLEVSPLLKSPPVYVTEPSTSTPKYIAKMTVFTQTGHGTSSVATQTKTDFLSDLSARKRKLTREIEIIKQTKENEIIERRQLQQEYFKMKKELETTSASLLSNSEDEVAQRFLKLVEWQNKIKNKFKGNRYDAEYKMFVLNLHYASPQAYRYLQTVMNLPCKRTLMRFKLQVPPKLEDRALNYLSLKLKSLPSNAKYCTICVGELRLKRNLYYDTKKDEIIGFQNMDGTVSPEIASNVYVIILQGIYCNWNQPITYSLLGNTDNYVELDFWINSVILKLFGIGIEVKAVITDQGSNFEKYANTIKNVTVDKPYFFVDEHKIFYIFDVPHLLKCVRDKLLSSDFYYQEDQISWDYIKTLYEYQKVKNLRLIPKITNAHMEPDHYQRTLTKYVAQMFSNTVCAALETYIDFGIIAEEARGTAKFIKIMNDLFDVLNSSKNKSDRNYQNSFSMSIEQTAILDDAQNMFAAIKSKNHNTLKNTTDNDDHINTFQSFQITIQAILQLFECLKSEGFESLLTRRLNQDNLVKFFGSMRKEWQTNKKFYEPTAIQFTSAFSKLFNVSMLKSEETISESIISEILHKTEEIIKKEKETLEPPNLITPSLVVLSGEDYHIDIPESNALTYVASFLLFECSRKSPNCKEIKNMLDSSLNLDQTNFKAYNKNKSFYGNLKMPSQEIIEYVKKLDTAFTQTFGNHIGRYPGSDMFKSLQKIPVPPLSCCCFPVNNLLSLFVRLRIFLTLKLNQEKFKSTSASTQQYLIVKQLSD